MKPYLIYVSDETEPPEFAIPLGAELVWSMALDTIWSEYREDVCSIANDVYEQAAEHGPEAAEKLIHETVDSSSWVIYYQNQNKLLLVSENAKAWRDTGELPDELGERLLVEENANGVRAYYAMVADVREALDKLIKANPWPMT